MGFSSFEGDIKGIGDGRYYTSNELVMFKTNLTFVCLIEDHIEGVLSKSLDLNKQLINYNLSCCN